MEKLKGETNDDFFAITAAMEKLKGETNDDFFAITAATFLYMDIENLGKLIHLQFVHGNISE
jgi:hypothetical protein